MEMKRTSGVFAGRCGKAVLLPLFALALGAAGTARGADALIGRDYAVFLALLALTASFQLVGNLLSDVLYMLIDPRIDFAKR